MGTFCLVAMEKLRKQLQAVGKTIVFKEEGCIVNLAGQGTCSGIRVASKSNTGVNGNPVVRIKGYLK